MGAVQPAGVVPDAHIPSTTVCEIFGTLQQVPRFAVVFSLSLAAAAGGPACVPGATPLVCERMALTARGAREKDSLSTVICFVALVGNTCLKKLSSTPHRTIAFFSFFTRNGCISCQKIVGGRLAITLVLTSFPPSIMLPSWCSCWSPAEGAGGPARRRAMRRGGLAASGDAPPSSLRELRNCRAKHDQGEQGDLHPRQLTPVTLFPVRTLRFFTECMSH